MREIFINWPKGNQISRVTEEGNNSRTPFLSNASISYSLCGLNIILHLPDNTK